MITEKYRGDFKNCAPPFGFHEVSGYISHPLWNVKRQSNCHILHSLYLDNLRWKMDNVRFAHSKPLLATLPPCLRKLVFAIPRHQYLRINGIRLEGWRFFISESPICNENWEGAEAHLSFCIDNICTPSARGVHPILYILDYMICI